MAILTNRRTPLNPPIYPCYGHDWARIGHAGVIPRPPAWFRRNFWLETRLCPLGTVGHAGQCPTSMGCSWGANLQEGQIAGVTSRRNPERARDTRKMEIMWHRFRPSDRTWTSLAFFERRHRAELPSSACAAEGRILRCRRLLGVHDRTNERSRLPRHCPRRSSAESRDSR